MKNLITILASDPTILAFSSPHEIVFAAGASLPNEIVWMPAGMHSITAGTVGGAPFVGKVNVTESGARAAQASLQRATAAGRKPWIDFNHADGEAAAWVNSFSWDASRGIIASLEWTGSGVRALTEKQYRSFSPAFKLDRESGQVVGINEGFAAGGLVNAPAFGAAMPALIAARLAGADSAKPASGGSPDSQTKPVMNKEQLITLLASLGIQHAADASEQQLVALVLAHKPKPTATPNAEVIALQEQVASIQASHAAAKKRGAKSAVDAAIARGAIKKDDTVLQAFWAQQMEVNEETASVALAAIPGTQKSADAVIIATDAAAGSGEVTVTAKTGTVEVLKAMAKETDALKRGRIYRDVRKFIADGGPIMEVLAANTLGTLTSDLIVLRALDLLKLNFPILSRITTDFSAEQVKYGTPVKTRIITVPSVGTYNTTTGYGIAATTTTDVSVTINAHKHVTISYQANELGGTGRDLFGEQVEAMHYALGKDLVDALLALFVIGTYTNATTVATNSITRETLPVALASAFNVRGVPQMNRTLLLNAAAFAKLSVDTSIVQLATYQKPELITNYTLPVVSGFQPIETINLPATGNMTGFALTPDAALVVTRLPSDYTKALPGASHGSVSTVTNPDTGMSVLKTDFVDHTLGSAVSRIAWMYGVAAGQVASGQIIKSS